MKNIFIKTGLLSMAFVLLLSCDKFLEEDLRDQIATDNFFNNDQEALLASNGLYRILHRGTKCWARAFLFVLWLIFI